MMSNNSNEVIILVGPIVKSNSNNKSKCAKQDDDEELGAVEQQDDSPRDVQADLSMSSTAQSKPTGGGFFQGWQSSTGVRRLHSSRKRRDEKVVGLKHYGLENPVRQQLHHPAASFDNTGGRFAVEAKEEEVRRSATRNPFVLCCLANVAALKVMVYYLITLETIMSCIATVGLTIYWYDAYPNDKQWNGRILDFVLVAFALTAPITAALTMSFARRERALMWTADFRTWSYHLYLAHCLWDWDEKGGRTAAVDVDWLEHCDAVLAQLIGIGDELSRFLTLPTTSRSRHRHTKHGRREAARTIEVAYHLLNSMATQRLTRLVFYSERLKKIGLPSGEVSRLRQYERFLSSMIEQLRMVKMYRTPQAFRSFARIFTLLLPPFYAPSYAQVARDLDSLGVGICFGLLTALGLTMLFESQQILEDPFTAYLALDGIDVREEFEVLHFAQLTETRKLVFPDAPEYPAGRRAALTNHSSQKPTAHPHAIGLPPLQSHLHQYHYGRDNHSLASRTTLGADKYRPVHASDDEEEEEDAHTELGTRMDEGSTPTFRETRFHDDSESVSTLRTRRYGRRNRPNVL